MTDILHMPAEDWSCETCGWAPKPNKRRSASFSRHRRERLTAMIQARADAISPHSPSES